MDYSARDAFIVSNQVLNNFEAAYTHIAFLCMECIKQFSEFHYNSCAFSIPPFMIGFALYNVAAVNHRLRKHLRRLGYRVWSAPGGTRHRLHISWGHVFRQYRPDGTIS